MKLLAPWVVVVALAAAGNAGEATSSPLLRHTLKGHAAAVTTVAFASDGKTLASGGGYRDGSVRLWDTATGDIQRVFDGDNGLSIGAVAFAPSGELLAIGRSDLTVHLVQPQTGKTLHTVNRLKGGVNGLAFSSDGRLLAIACDADDAVALWHVDKGTLLTTMTMRWGAHAVAFSPDGASLAGGARFGSLLVWALPAGTLKQTLISTRTGGRIAVAFSPDGAGLASGGHHHGVMLWDARGSRGPRSLKSCGPQSPVAFSPDGRLLATGGEENDVKLWDPQTATLRESLVGHAAPVSSLAFTRDGKRLASGSGDETVRVWDVSKSASKD
jgi:WD40 repeat protein